MNISRVEWDQFWEEVFVANFGADVWYIEDERYSDDGESAILTIVPDLYAERSGGRDIDRDEKGVQGIVPSGAREVHLARALSAWRKAKSSVTLIVEIPRSKSDELSEAVRRLGGRLVK